MLYVGSVLDENTVEIMDTADGIAELVSKDYLAKCISLGIHINGVAINNGISIRNTPKELAKLSMLKGVNMKVSHGVLMCLDLRELKSDVTLRLSDYCYSIEDDAVMVKDICSHKATIILDDNVNFRVNSFIGGRISRLDLFRLIALDIREVTDESVVDRLYRLIPFNDFDYISLYKSGIIDSHERLVRYVALTIIGYISTHVLEDSVSMTIEAVGKEDFMYMHDFLLNKYLKSFRELSDIKLEVKPLFMEELNGDNGAVRKQRVINMIKSIMSCNTLNQECYSDIRAFLLSYATLDFDKVKCLFSFHNYFMIRGRDTEFLSYWDAFWNNLLRQARTLFENEYKEFI